MAFAQGLGVWVLDAPGGLGDAEFHAHHAIQLTVCFSGRLELGTEQQSLSGRALAVAPDTRHRLGGHGLIGLMFVEPESRLGRALIEKLFGTSPLVAIDDRDFLRLTEPLRAAIECTLSQQEMLETGWAATRSLASIEAVTAPDPRIQRIIDHAAAHLDQPLTLTGAGAGVYLSESRLRHLFVEQTGLAFKTYVLWLRLVRAVQIYAEGQSLTEAAHAAGFADSAHFSRVFKRSFGSPASTLTRL